METLRSKKGFICDMDGVIYHGNKLLDGVKEFVEWLQREDKSFLFLTNASSRSPRELHEKLLRMGLDVGEEHFYTSALATAKFLQSQAPGCSAYVIGDHGLYNALYDAGITIDDVSPDYVVVGETTTYGYEHILRGKQRCQAHCNQHRHYRSYRRRNRTGLPCICGTYRGNHRQTGILCRQAKPSDDAYRTSYFGRTFQ